MKQTYLNLTHFQILNLFPVNLPCNCKMLFNNRYNVILEYHIGHCLTWVKTATILCKGCNAEKTYDVLHLKVSINEVESYIGDYISY